jgi:hypothetical protein
MGLTTVAHEIRRQSRVDEAQPADVIVVLGAAEYRGRPSPVLEARLNHALFLYLRSLAPRILTTGGAGGDPSFTERHWEGQQVGTGRRRQGNSTEIDRHADPRNKLEDRSLKEDRAFMAAAEDIPDAAERRKTTKKARGGRTDGSPVAPTGVPKADHVADPENAPPTNGVHPRPQST